MKTDTHNVDPATQLTLVIAANGKTGSRVANLLEAKGVSVRRGSRTGSPAFDWNDRGTWASALKGVDSVYIAYTPDLSIPKAQSDIEQLITCAREAGVQKLVLLSGRGEDGAVACEQLVQNSGLRWSIVRAGWFNQNFSEGGFLEMVQDGVIALPDLGVLEPFVDVNDIAEVAAEALVDPRHDSEIYEVTGPTGYRFSDLAAILSDAIGKPIRYQPITMDEFIKGMQDEQVPELYVELMRYLFELTATGCNSDVRDGVKRALNREPIDFQTYATRAAATGVWDSAVKEMNHA